MIWKNLTMRYVLAFTTVFLVISGCSGCHSMTKQQNNSKQDVEQQQQPQVLPANTEKAAFAAGCFWHVEYAFSRIPGVVKTTVGYTAGHTEEPTYKQVCTDKTGHAEAVEVIYDPQKVTYQQLLDAFWKMHDPTQLNRQGPDVGTQYRSAVFYYNDRQKTAAEKSKQKLSQSGKFDKPIVTEIVPAEKFYKAEEYHQKYFQKHGKTCGI